MKNKDVLELYRGLIGCGVLTGIEFSYAVAKNVKKLKPEVELITTEIEKIQISNCLFEEGKPIFEEVNGQKQYKMEDMKKFEEEYKELMELDSETELYYIKKENLPVNISAAQFSSIMEIVEE